MEAVGTIRGALGARLPRIGFAGSPWTLATYMVEGRGGSDYARIKGMAYDAPELLDALLAKLSASVSVYLERSEAHTSELQSLMRISYAVFCLNKKRAYTYQQHTIRNTAT